jgi:hypothetical protein
VAMRSLGAEVIEFGRDFQDWLEHAGRLSKESGLHFINSFDFVLVQGVASYALELFRSVPELDSAGEGGRLGEATLPGLFYGNQPRSNARQLARQRVEQKRRARRPVPLLRRELP